MTADGNMPAPSIRSALTDIEPSGFGRIQTSRTGETTRRHEREPHKRLTHKQSKVLEDFEDNRPLPATWTPDHVGYRLVMAFRIMNRTPRIGGPKSYGNGWPSMVRDADDLKGWSSEDNFERLVHSAIKPTRAEITRMDAAFKWLEELRAHDAGQALQLMYWASAMASRRNLHSVCDAKKWAYSTFRMKAAGGRKWIAARLAARGDGVF